MFWSTVFQAKGYKFWSEMAPVRPLMKRLGQSKCMSALSNYGIDNIFSMLKETKVDQKEPTDNSSG
jgi:hypothetical protein